jgi:hypothetical protein
MTRDKATRDLGMVALYLKGDKLQPDVITSLLGIEPTKARGSGQLRSKSGYDGKRVGGLWEFSVDFQSEGAVPVLEKLLETLVRSGVDLSRLPGVDEAFIDFFISREALEDGQLDVSLSFPSPVIELLARTKLRFQFTFAGIPSVA